MRGSRSGGSPLLLLRGWTSPACGHTGRPSPDLTSFSSSFVSSFCTRLFRDEECLDRWGLSECSYSKVVVDSTFHSPKTLPKSLPTRQVLTLPSWSRSKEITALPTPPSARPQTQPKKNQQSASVWQLGHHQEGWASECSDDAAETRAWGTFE